MRASLPSRSWIPLALALAVAVTLFAGTRMRTISGCPGEYCVDSGEFQVALALGGTVHHTGYPLYMLLGTPFVRMLAMLGVAPAEGASWYSLLWAAAAVAATWWAARVILDDPWIALAPAVTVAVLPVFWLHAVVPEVYSLHFFFSALVIALTVRLMHGWSPRLAWLLALIAGAAVAHHRLAAPTIATAALALAPTWWRSPDRWRWLVLGALCALAGFLPYLDMPLRALSGTPWVYGRPDTWEGFWFIFSGREAADFGQMHPFPAGLWGSLQIAAGAVVGEIGWPLLVLSALGAASGLAQSGPPRRASLTALGFAAVGLTFAAAYSAVLPVSVMVFPALVGAALLTGVAIAQLGARLPRLPHRWLRGLAVTGAVAWVMVRAESLAPEIRAMTGNDSNVRYMTSAEVDLEAPPRAVLMAPFGERFNALAYAHYVDGALADFHLVDHRADFASLVGAGPVYTSAETLYVQPLDWWRERLGSESVVNGAGPGWVAIGPPLTNPDPPAAFLGDGIAISNVSATQTADGEAWHVSVTWAAIDRPRRDYSTVVFASDQDLSEITAPDQIVAQSDSRAPVYGWHPTSTWRPGEAIHEDHALAWPEGRELLTLVIGAYVQEADGSFTTLGRAAWHRIDNTWIPAGDLPGSRLGILRQLFSATLRP